VMDDGSSLSLLAWTPEADAVANMAKAVSLRKMHFMLTEVIVDMIAFAFYERLTGRRVLG